MVEFCLTLFLSFPGCSHPGLVGAPSPGFVFTGLVAWLLLAPRSWKPPSQSTPFARSVVLWRWCGADYSLLLVFLAYYGALWLMALRSSHCHITAGLASMDRPLLVSSVESQLWGFCSSNFLVFGWSLRDGVTLSGRGCPRSRSERRLFAHLP